MGAKKASRVELLEKQVLLMGTALQNMDQAIRWLVKEVKSLKPAEAGKDPNQTSFDFNAKLDDEKKVD